MTDSNTTNIKFTKSFTSEELEMLRNTLSSFQENYNSYMRQTSNTLTVFNNSVNKSMRQSLVPLSQMIKQQNKAIVNSMKMNVAPLLKTIERQQIELRETLASFNKLNLEIPKIYFEKIETIYTSISDDFTANKLQDDLEVNPDNIQNSIKQKSITLSDIIAIIALLITLISFIQDQFPDKQVETQIESLNQLIEIQSELLEQNKSGHTLSE